MGCCTQIGHRATSGEGKSKGMGADREGGKKKKNKKWAAGLMQPAFTPALYDASSAPAADGLPLPKENRRKGTVPVVTKTGTKGRWSKTSTAKAQKRKEHAST
ncbi:hypothetical protein WOLCODRAFT_139425 [Wolfiporia cocos MD-104 SS10]|uniref:Uncharacterized protein n=1 Tax=Wolfiporia cocos (strain MD-104) TaxID=742152 RepID=A0A2H3JCY4_WOLCO|nr:hypothetical protein WOLCODRAFT_139425 [Wolfiporia cocos MD-104 SS10]